MQTKVKFHDHITFIEACYDILVILSKTSAAGLIIFFNNIIVLALTRPKMCWIFSKFSLVFEL